MTPIAIDFWKLKHQIDDEIIRLGWTKDECISYIQQRYNKRSRLVMSDEEMISMRDELRVIQPIDKVKRRRRKRRP